MSGFYADNSRIKITETVGNNVETAFDTEEGMPHIIGTAYVANVGVDFANLTQTQNYAYYDTCRYATCLDYAWYYQGVTAWSWGYQSVYVPGTWGYERTYSYSYYGGGWSYARVSTYGYTYYERTYTSYYTYERVWETVWTGCCAETVYEYSIDARESSTVTDIANVPLDEDGNPVPIDFIVVQATGTRTVAGNDPRFSQAFVTTVPTKTFSFQGSVLLEASGTANGSSWFRRIMSVYTSGSKVKLQVQESVARLMRGAYDSGFPNVGSSRSAFNFNFKIFFGRFKS